MNQAPVKSELNSKDYLVRAIEQLPEKLKLAMSLYYVDTLSEIEIAAVLGITEFEVKIRLEEALQELRTTLRPGCD